MNIAIIFAGGAGQRMNSKTTPKQFLELHGKPIILYTLEQFENHPDIDGIIVVCLKDWIAYCKGQIRKYGLNKVRDVIPGGETGMLSRFNGIQRAAELYPPDTICLMHDGVRPLIDDNTISVNIASVKRYGSAITSSPAIETVVVRGEGSRVDTILDRSKCQMARAPQSFRLGELLDAHRRAVENGMNDCIDTAFLMQAYGHALFFVEGPPENIKITTPPDFYIFRALMDARENSQIFGL